MDTGRRRYDGVGGPRGDDMSGGLWGENKAPKNGGRGYFVFCFVK